MKAASSIVFGLVAVILLASQWRLSTVSEQRHQELLQTYSALQQDCLELRQAIDESKEPSTTSFNAYLPIPGLGDVKFTAEVPTEDIAKVGASINKVPGAETVTDWVFGDEIDDEVAAGPDDASE